MPNERHPSRLADLREKAGLTQKALAERVGVSEGTIANWENDRGGLDKMIAQTHGLCEALKCSLEDLINCESYQKQIKSPEERKTLREILKTLGTNDSVDVGAPSGSEQEL